MNCCDDYGVCTRGKGCPAGSFKPALPAEGRDFFTPVDAQQRAKQLGQPLYRVSMLRITGSDGRRWYRGMVGQLVPYCGWEVGEGFVSREPAGYLNFVEFEHATRVDVAVTAKELSLWPAKHAGEADRGSPYTRTAKSAPAKPVQASTATSAPTNTATSTQASTQIGQSRAGSLAEALTNVVVGFVVSVLITAVLLPAMGHAVTLTENILMTAVFTVASIARSYLLRRAFNRGAAA